MYINNDDFEKWMERLSKKLNDIGKDLKSLVNTNEVFDKDEKLLDNQDLCFMLRCSKRTLQRHRSNGVLPFLRYGQKSTIGQTMFVHLFGNIAIIELFRSLKRTIHPKSKPMQMVTTSVCPIKRNPSL